MHKTLGVESGTNIINHKVIDSYSSQSISQ